MTAKTRCIGTFYVAYSALACIQSVRIKQHKEMFESVLDLPCGHGRVLRALKAAFPGANFTACDLDQHGVDFCVRRFGAAGVYSNLDPNKIRIYANFDLRLYACSMGQAPRCLGGEVQGDSMNVRCEVLSRGNRRSLNFLRSEARAHKNQM